MDPRLIYWSFALLVLLLMVAAALLGWWSARRKDVRRHRLFMNTSVVLCLFFLVSYVWKVFWLGKEDLSVWSRSDLLVLRIHELLVGTMLVLGGGGRLIAGRFSRWILPSGHLSSAGEDRRKALRLHRRMGRIAILISAAALITAALILAGMYQRALPAP
ncbi:MAG: DUF420 domain-containing protein [Thermoanaerobaculia bacterium]